MKAAYEDAKANGAKKALGNVGISTAIVSGLFAALIVFVVGTALVGPVADSVSGVNTSNLDSGSQALLNLLPLLFIAIIAGAGVAAVVKAFKS